MEIKTWLVLAAMPLLAGPSHAASRIAKNRCGDAARALNGRMLYAGKSISPQEMKDAADHAKRMMGSWKQAQSLLAQIPESERNWKDPELNECVAKIQTWKNYLAELGGKLKGASAGASSLAPFLKEVKRYERSLYTLAAAHFSPATDVFNGRPPEETRKYQEDMAAVEALCDEKFPDAGKDRPVMPTPQPGQQYQRIAGVSIPNSFSQDADNWCWIAKNRKELMNRAAGSQHTVVEGYGNVKMVLPMTLKTFSAQNPGLETWIAAMLLDPKAYFDKLQKARAADNAAQGTEPAAADNSAVEDMLRQLQAKVDAAAPSGKLPKAGAHDSAIENSAAKAMKSIYPESKVVVTQMDAPGWAIEKNALGVPLTRYRSGQLAFSLPNSKWCLHRVFNWVETYSGGGNYEPPSGASILPSTRFIACP
jgi:hypothetical protein